MRFLRKHIDALLITSILIILSAFFVIRFNTKDITMVEHKGLEKIYASTDELIENSNSIVIGQVVKVHGPKLIPVESSSEKVFEKIVLEIDIKLDKTLKGTLQKGEIISVEKIIGHKIGSESIMRENINNFNESEMLTLFLRKSDNYDFYYPINNYQGALKIKGDKYSSYDIYSEIEIDKNYFPMFDDNMTVKDLEEKIKNK